MNDNVATFMLILRDSIFYFDWVLGCNVCNGLNEEWAVICANGLDRYKNG